MIPFVIDSGLSFAIVLAVILFFTKFFGLLFRHFGLPQVLGYIVAGILVGPAIFGDFFGFCLIGAESPNYTPLFLLDGTSGGETFSMGVDGLEIFSKIGVLFLMFSTGLETNLQELRKTGLAATLVACAGVAVPMILGILICLPFGDIGLGPQNIYRCIFVGAILTATSVAITVSVLKELGKISTKLGTTIVSAAIIDDVIGIIVLSIVSGIAKSGTASADANAFETFKATPYGTVIMIIAFFVVAIGLGFLVSKTFRWMERRWPNTHRLPVFSIVICFFYAWLAEEIFGVADITGAFLAGIILSTAHRSSIYTDKKVDVNTYTMFAPVFFANIGISQISFAGLDGKIILWAFLAVVMGLIGKVIGCGSVAKAFKYNMKESAIAGVGMMARGEVALIVTATATSAELGQNALPMEFTIMTVLLILFSSILTPILLKVLYREHKPHGPEGGESVTDGEGSHAEAQVTEESVQAPAEGGATAAAQG